MDRPSEDRRRGLRAVAAAAGAAVAVLAGLVVLVDATSPGPAADGGDSAEAARVARLLRSAQELRGLELSAPVAISRVDRQGVVGVVRRLSAADADPALVRATDQALRLMGRLGADQHLESLATEGVAAQVAGLYDPGADRLYLVDDSGIGASDGTLLHELVHALQDARFDLDGGVLGADPADADRRAAALALVEGDATDVQQRYLQTAGAGALLDELATSLGQAAAIPQGRRTLPRFLQRSLEFSYLRGLGFVQALRASGGQAAVDRAFANPPATTLAVIRPGRYLTGNPPPRAVRLPRVRAGEVRVLTTTFGAADLLALGVAEPLAATWRGGKIVLDRRGRRGRLTIVMASTRARALAGAVRRVLPRSARVGSAGSVLTVRIAGEVGAG